VHNSRRPLDRLTLTLTWNFDLWPDIHWWGRTVSWWTIPMPSSAILVSAVLVLSCGQTDRQTDSITELRINAILTRLPSAWVINDWWMAIHVWIIAYMVAQKTGPPYLIANILKIPWPNCVEISELLQYYMLNTVIDFLFKNFIALWRHLAKTQLLCDAQIYLYNMNKGQ